MLRTLILTLLALINGGSAHSLPATATPQQGFQHPGPPLAIDGVEISWAEYANWLVLLQGYDNLDSYVSNYLIQREFERAGLEIETGDVLKRTQAEIATRVERTFGGDRSAWIAELERLGQSEEGYLKERRREIWEELRRDQLVQSRRVVNEEAVRDAWQDQYGPGGHQVFVSRLLLRVNIPHSDAAITRDESQELGRKAKEETRLRAEALYKRIQNEGQFEARVAEFSDDFQTRKSGGKLPDPVVLKDWPGVDASALESVTSGQLMPPFHCNGGYQLFLVNRVQITPFDEVKEALRKTIEQQPAGQSELTTLLNGLRNNSTIELLDEVHRELLLDKPRFDRPVAMVDGQPLFRGDFSRWLVNQRGAPLARSFAQKRWAVEQARAAGCTPTPLEVEQRVQLEVESQIDSYFSGDREKWLDNLTKKGRNLVGLMHQAKLRVQHSLRSEGLMLAERIITPEMIQREWEERYGKDGQSLDVRYILRDIPDPPQGLFGSDAELEAYVKEQTDVAIAFLSSLGERSQDGEDFGALARTHSHDQTTRDRGGRGAGRFTLNTWPEFVQEQLRELRPGEVTAPVNMNLRFFLFELAGSVQVPLAEVSEQLREELRLRAPSSAEIAGFINAKTRQLDIRLLPSIAGPLGR